MIPIAPQPEPQSFDAQVRQPGEKWLRKYPDKITDFPTHWRKCLPDLHAVYHGVCAYLCVHIELASGAASVDHFIAKSHARDKIYEWDNYRLACLKMNARKRDFMDVLDPFFMTTDVFRLELATGRIYVNPAATDPLAQTTIERLQLDDGLSRSCRQKYFDLYLKLLPSGRDIALSYLQQYAPFVQAEVLRQGL